MKKNVGTADRVIRVLLGLALFSLYFILEENMRYLSLIGLIPFVTGLVSACPLYSIFGIRTCPVKSAAE